MTKRRRTKTVNVGDVKIGSSQPIVIQSMTKVSTTDIERCVNQIKALAKAGGRLVRVAVPRRADTTAFAKIVKRVKIPLIADVHFSVERAIEAIEAGAAKIRLNPGNIKSRDGINRIIDSAKMHKTAIRIGVNEASIRDLRKDDVKETKRAALILMEVKRYVRLFEKRGFEQLVLSAKSRNCLRTIEINRRIAESYDYPMHIGLTHSGLLEDSQIPSAIAIGTLLTEGIGDTIRVSAAGDPVKEIEIAKNILNSLGLYKDSKPELIVCPTCGRAEIDVIKLAGKVKKIASRVNKPVRIAVMGCIVNGPGEAADADLAVCGGKEKGYIYRHGRKIATVNESNLIAVLERELRKL